MRGSFVRIPFVMTITSLAVLAIGAPAADAGDPIAVPIEVTFVRGDVNGDGFVELDDAIGLLSYLFPQGPGPGAPTCLDTVDANDDEVLTLADGLHVLTYLFLGGPAMPPPFPDCGFDPTNPNEVTCLGFPICGTIGNEDLAGHVLRRLTYGVTPSELDRVTEMGALAFIDEQLDPDAIDESDNALLNALLAGLQPDVSYTDLYKLQFVQGLYARRQLRETLTDFWDNHFNTRIWTIVNSFNRLSTDLDEDVYTYSESRELATFHEHEENQRHRAGGLGSFQDLVEGSAKSVTMLIYLDNISNIAAEPNENYARELLELHTMGVDNGYTQTDIEEVARCFTGWTICLKDPADVGDPHAPCLPLTTDPTGVWDFSFDPANHDYDAKLIFENTSYQLNIPARTPGSADGINDGLEVIAHLVTLPQTAEFISTKLVQKFVADDAPESLVAACLAEWIATGGDLGAVMTVLLHSNEFLGQAHRWNKVRTPQESILATVRAFDGVTATQPVQNAIGALGHLPFNFGTPDGFPESGADQLGTAKVLERIKFAKLIDEGSAVSTDPDYDLPGLLTERGVPLDDVDAIVAEFFRILFQSSYTAVDFDLAVEFLSTDDFGNVVPLDPMDSDYEARLGHFAAFVASFPQALKQ